MYFHCTLFFAVNSTVEFSAKNSHSILHFVYITCKSKLTDIISMEYSSIIEKIFFAKISNHNKLYLIPYNNQYHACNKEEKPGKQDTSYPYFFVFLKLSLTIFFIGFGIPSHWNKGFYHPAKHKTNA